MKTPSTKIERFAEYWITEIDHNGDSIDPQPFSGRGSAVKARKEWAKYQANFEEAKQFPEAVAAIFERVEGKGSDAEGIISRDEETIDTVGSQDAIIAGGWIR